MSRRTRVWTLGAAIGLSGLAGMVYALDGFEPQLDDGWDDVVVPSSAGGGEEVRGLGKTVRLVPANRPGFSCIEVDGLVDAYGNRASGACTETRIVNSHGLVLAVRNKTGTVTVYGSGPTGATGARVGGRDAVVGANTRLFLAENVELASSRIEFRTVNGLKTFTVGAP